MKANIVYFSLSLLLSIATASSSLAADAARSCHSLFKAAENISATKEGLISQIAKDVPKGASVGPVAGMPIRDVILRFLSGIPSPDGMGRTMGTRQMLDLWKSSDSGLSAQWVMMSPMVLEMSLNLAGPFGPYGPLSLRQAPLGKDAGSPWYWWKQMVMGGVWNTAPHDLFKNFGPLNPDTGVLSQVGPDSNPWFQGILDFLGTNSPLGPKGPLGVLGPMGSVMSMRAMHLDDSGVYVDRYTKRVVNSVLMPNHTRGHGPVDMIKYDIVKDLSAKFSDELSEAGLLDTSFMNDHTFVHDEKQKTYRVTARNSEMVTALVIPDHGLILDSDILIARPLNYTLEVLTVDGTPIVKSDMKSHANLIRFQVRAGERYEIRVSSQGYALPFTEDQFRLVMTGSTSYYAKQLWEEVLGTSFTEVMEMSSEPDRELGLNFIWASVVKQAWSDFAQIKKNPAFLKGIDLKNYWHDQLRTTLEHYTKIRSSSGSLAAARGPLMAGMKTSIAQYKAIIGDAHFTGDQVLDLYVKMWGGGVEAEETHFNMTAEQAAQVPAGWLNMLEGNYAQLMTRFDPGKNLDVH